MGLDLDRVGQKLRSLAGALVSPLWAIRRIYDYLVGTPRRIYVINLGLIWLFGVLGCGWVLRYSDWFEIVGGLLTLGGVFTWLAFVSNILTEDRTKELQGWVEKNILERKRTLGVVALLLLAGGLFLALFVGTIQIESLQEPLDRAVYIYPAGSEDRGEPERLPAGHVLRAPRWTSWWSPARYVVKVSGYPDAVLTLRPLNRKELRVPYSFRRPVVLLRPTPFLADMVAHDVKKLIVTVTRKLKRKTGETIEVIKTDPEPEFSGQAFWIGCDEDVQVPQAIQDRWLYQLGADQRLSAIWRRPKTFAGRQINLKPGDSVQAELLDKNGAPKFKTITAVQSPQGRDEFVIEEVLDVSKSRP